MSDKDIVSEVRAFLAEKLGRDRYDLWFGASTHMVFCGKTLVVETANKFSQDWLRRHYRGSIEAAGTAAAGDPVDVEFRLNSRLKATAPSAEHEPVRRPAGQPKCELLFAAAVADRTEAHSAAQTPPGAMLLVNRAEKRSSTVLEKAEFTPRRRFAALQNFVVGSGNRLAHASALMVSERLGSLNPFLVYGPPGCGKTHLLEGICTAVRSQGRTANAVFLSAEQFTTFFVEALRGSGLPNFRRKYRAVDLLVIDDLQFLAGKRATLIELLHTIDALLRDGRQLAFASDRAPAELTKLGPELTTRLAGGMVCQLEPPDAAMRYELVHHFARRLETEFSDDVARLVASQINSGAREIFGAVKRLHAASRVQQCRLDPATAQETLAELLHSSQRAIRLCDIEAAVCETFGLPGDSLQSNHRTRNVSTARMLAMWLARKLTRAGLSEIGQYFGRRSHSTVISAQKRVDHWMARHSDVVIANANCKVDEALRRVESRLRVG